MAYTTDNLGFFLADPATDGEEAFNIKTQINDNFLKTDAAIGDLYPAEETLGMEGASIAEMLTALADVGQLHVWRKYNTSGYDWELEDIVVSPDPAAYPTGGFQDNHFFTYEGVMGSKPRLEWLAYEGTGGTTNRIETRRQAALVIIMRVGARTPLIWVRGTILASSGASASSTQLDVTFNGSTAEEAMNLDHVPYVGVVVYDG